VAKLEKNARIRDMKTLIVITKSEIGGAQVFALDLARGLRAAGIEMTVAGGPGEYLPAELAKSGIAFRRLKNLERSRNPFKIWGFIQELKAYVAAEKFTVVHLNSTNALFGVWGLSRLQPRPRIIFTVHGLSLLDSGHQAPGILRDVYRLFFKAAFKRLDDLVFVSRLNLKSALASGLLEGGLADKSHLIYNGRDFAPGYLIDRAEARMRLAEILKLGPKRVDGEPGLPADFQNAFIYGSIGRLAYPKNYEFLINAHRAVKAIRPNAKLLLIGEGPERAKYEGLIKSYKLENEVYLSGEISEASRYLRVFDLFVLPSVFEGLSLSLIEARRAGVPALASKVGGNEEIVGVERCFALNDQAGFLKLVENLEEEKKSSGSEDLSEPDFSAKTMIKEYLEIYQG
jgi:glycosyltransferase involved in cell wall biosynthesis